MAVVRVTQVQGDGRPMGAPRESDCPQNGCQVGIPLALGKSESLLVNTIVTFVSRGIYLSLEAAVPSSGRVREYGQSRPGTVFVPEPRSGSAVRQFGLTVERDGVPSIGALPDAYLRVEIITGSAAAPGLSPDQGGLLPRS